MHPTHVVRSRALAASALLAASILACSRLGGDGDTSDGGVSPADPSPVGGELALGTQVSLASMSYDMPELALCIRPSVDTATLRPLGGFTLDGTAAKWAAIPVASESALGNAAAGYDLGALKMASGPRGELVLFAVFKPAAEAALILNLGGLVVRDGKLVHELRRSVRYLGGKLSEKVGASWHELAADEADAVQGVEGVEVRLSERLVADAGNWPAWWLEAAVVASDGTQRERLHDATSAVYLQSLVKADEKSFRIEGCREWGGQRHPFVMRTLYEAAVADAKGRSRDYPDEAAIAWAMSLTRAAWGATSRLLEPIAPATGGITVLLSQGGFDEGQLAAAADVADVSYLGVRLDVRQLLAEGGTLFMPSAAFFEKASLEFARLILVGAYPQAGDFLLKAAARAIADEVTQKGLGWNYWLDAFAPTDDAARFGHLLASEVGASRLIAAWLGAGARRDAALAPEQALLAALLSLYEAEADRQRILALWQGWAQGGQRVDPFRLDSFLDPDFDGIPSFLERHIGSDPNKMDSDGDGWSDLAEWVSGSEPLVASKHPGRLMPDQKFDDWLTLVPKRVTIDRGHSGSCPKAADISHYAAVADAETLLVGAFIAEFWHDEPAARWEALVDLPQQQRQLLVTAVSSSRRYAVKDAASGELLLEHVRATPLGRTAIELMLDRRSLGLARFTDEKDGMKIRLRTVFGGQGDDHFCDESEWFSAIFSL